MHNATLKLNEILDWTQFSNKNMVYDSKLSIKKNTPSILTFFKILFEVLGDSRYFSSYGIAKFLFAQTTSPISKIVCAVYTVVSSDRE